MKKISIIFVFFCGCVTVDNDNNDSAEDKIETVYAESRIMTPEERPAALGPAIVEEERAEDEPTTEIRIDSYSSDSSSFELNIKIKNKTPVIGYAKTYYLISFDDDTYIKENTTSDKFEPGEQIEIVVSYERQPPTGIVISSYMQPLEKLPQGSVVYEDGSRPAHRVSYNLLGDIPTETK